MPSTSSRYPKTIATIRAHGYHGRRADAVAIYRRSRSISWAAYFNAYAEGQNARKAGDPCTCPECST